MGLDDLIKVIEMSFPADVCKEIVSGVGKLYLSSQECCPDAGSHLRHEMSKQEQVASKSKAPWLSRSLLEVS